MKKIKIEKLSDEAMEIYRKFQEQTGSQHIATPVNLEALIRLCQEYKPKRILELGGGIGTISYTLLSSSEAILDIYEDNEFCQNKLKENLIKFEGRYQVISSYRVLPPAQQYDLIVVDGGNVKSWDGGFNQAIWFYVHYLKSLKLFYFEGYRRLQRFWARKALRHRYIYKLIKYDKMEWEGASWKGGLLIECRPSNSAVLRFLNFVYWELVEWYPIKNFLQYRFGRLKLVRRVLK